MKNNENVKERKSFKEVVVENRGKIIAGVGVVTTVTLGVVLTKNYKKSKELAESLLEANAKVELGNLINTELWEKVQTTEDIIVNSGIIEQAKATITRKRDTLISKINCLENMDQISDEIVNKIKEFKGGVAGFDKMLDNCDQLEYLYKCREIGEHMLED